MKKIFIIFAAMAAVLSSCQKSELESVSANEIKDIVLNISVSNPGADTDTKVLIKTGWAKDDRIKIWYDSNTGETPDLVIKYDGDKDNWSKDISAIVSGRNPSTGADKYIKAVYNNYVIVYSKDNYTFNENTLTFNIKHWSFLTEIQVVVKGITYDYNATYKLKCDRFTPTTGTGFFVGADGITAKNGNVGNPAKGIPNADGVAFVFATAEYSTSSGDNKDFTFTLTDDSTGEEVTKVYKPNVVIEAMDGKKSINALTININKFAAITGSAKRTGDIDVKWVQLWAGGPKFAEYNVGASSATDKGITMTFTDATKAGAAYVWGANWCTPSKEDMEHLMTAAKGQTDDKVTCVYTQENSTLGFKFTGKGDYTDNSVFFPVQLGDNGCGSADYWSSTVDGGDVALSMHLGYDTGSWLSDWRSCDQSDVYLVRPVLRN